MKEISRRTVLVISFHIFLLLIALTYADDNSFFPLDKRKFSAVNNQSDIRIKCDQTRRGHDQKHSIYVPSNHMANVENTSTVENELHSFSFSSEITENEYIVMFNTYYSKTERHGYLKSIISSEKFKFWRIKEHVGQADTLPSDFDVLCTDFSLTKKVPTVES